MTTFIKSASLSVRFLLFTGTLFTIIISSCKKETIDPADGATSAGKLKSKTASLPPADMIAYWGFDGNGDDLTGNGNIATLYNVTAATDRFGNSAGAFHFDGSTSYAEVADNSALRLNGIDFTLNAWVKLDSYNGSYNSSIMSKRLTGANNGWFFGVQGNASSPGYVIYGPGGGSTNAFSSSTVGLSNWHMITAVYDYANSELSIYIDGSLSSTSSSILTANGSITANLKIGMDDLGGYYLEGDMDDISIYGRALTYSEIQQVYNHVPAPTGNLIAYWPFDGSGADLSGNGNTASIYNLYSTTDRLGNPNGAFYFDGSTGYAAVADNAALRLNGTDFTLNAWVRLDSYNWSYNSSILSKRITGANNGWFFGVQGYSSSAGTVIYGPGGGSTNAFSSSSVGLSSWHMITAVYDYTNNELSIYIDGSLNSVSSSILTANGSITADLKIGMDDLGGYYLEGALDDIRIYGRALSGTEVQDLFVTIY